MEYLSIKLVTVQMLLSREAIVFPKKIIHIGREWDIITEEQSGGASWDWDKATITIGIKGQPVEILERIIHEILEMTLMNQCSRWYCQQSDENYLFVMDHRGFTQALEISLPVVLQFLRFDLHLKQQDNLMERFTEMCAVTDH